MKFPQAEAPLGKDLPTHDHVSKFQFALIATTIRKKEMDEEVFSAYFFFRLEHHVEIPCYLP